MSDGQNKTALVLSGGGTRAAYQVGALKALQEYYPLEASPFSIIFGSSIGAVNGILLAAGLRNSFDTAVSAIEEVWRERTFGNSFAGSISLTLVRSLYVGAIQCLSPGPKPTTAAIFDPTPLSDRIEGVLNDFGGAHVNNHPHGLHAVGVMTTREGEARRGLLLVNAREKLGVSELQGKTFDIHYAPQIHVQHALASAALPSVLPPVELALETGDVRLVDGGISDNRPIDPAVRFGAKKIVMVDVSGRKWWCDHFGQPHDTCDPWDTPADEGSYCSMPEQLLELRNMQAFGPVLREAVGPRTRDRVRAFGPTWPIFRLLRANMGEELAFEVMSYAVILPDYIQACIEFGYHETQLALEHHANAKKEAALLA